MRNLPEVFTIIFQTVSGKKIDQLRECQVFLDTKSHKMLRPSQTRWLSLQVIFILNIYYRGNCEFVDYFQTVVDRILENGDALILVFTEFKQFE